jgi:hypothetical protein
MFLCSTVVIVTLNTVDLTSVEWSYEQTAGSHSWWSIFITTGSTEFSTQRKLCQPQNNGSVMLIMIRWRLGRSCGLEVPERVTENMAQPLVWAGAGGGASTQKQREYLNAEVYKSRAPGRPGDQILCGAPNICGSLLRNLFHATLRAFFKKNCGHLLKRTFLQGWEYWNVTCWRLHLVQTPHTKIMFSPWQFHATAPGSRLQFLFCPTEYSFSGLIINFTERTGSWIEPFTCCFMCIGNKCCEGFRKAMFKSSFLKVSMLETRETTITRTS